MATKTTTVRVPVETRDRLAAQARQRRLSLSAFLSKLAEQGEREAIFRAEREATIADSRDPEVLAEDEEWSETTPDGFD